MVQIADKYSLHVTSISEALVYGTWELIKHGRDCYSCVDILQLQSFDGGVWEICDCKCVLENPEISYLGFGIHVARLHPKAGICMHGRGAYMS